MANNYAPTVADAFGLLDGWRHLPAYGLETRAAPFFALFLREVLSTKLGVELHSVVIPEFPLRIGTLNGENGTGSKQGSDRSKQGLNQSYNVDYVVFSQEGRTAYLVELKTDMGSLREDQYQYLIKARDVGVEKLVSGIKLLAKVSDKKPKYVHLLHLLSKTGVILIPDDTSLYENSFPKAKRGWRAALEKVEVIANDKFAKPEIVFIQPTVNGDSGDDQHKFVYIDFNEVADIVQRHGDLGCIFANYLRQWTCPAGSRDPRGPR